MQEFKDGLFNEFAKTCTPYALGQAEIDRINQLVDQKYSTYDWNIGASPKGSNKFTHKFGFGIFTLQFDTVGGIIQSPQIYGDFFCKQDLSVFKQKLDGVPMEKSAMLKVFSTVDEYICGAIGEEIVNAIFGD